MAAGLFLFSALVLSKPPLQINQDMPRRDWERQVPNLDACLSWAPGMLCFQRVQDPCGPRRPEPLVKGKGVHREVGSEGSQRQSSDPANRNRIEGRHGGVDCEQSWPWTGTPDSHPDTRVGKSGGSRMKETQLILGDLRVCPCEPGYPAGNSRRGPRRSQQRP